MFAEDSQAIGQLEVAFKKGTSYDIIQAGLIIRGALWEDTLITKIEIK